MDIKEEIKKIFTSADKHIQHAVESIDFSACENLSQAVEKVQSLAEDSRDFWEKGY